MLVEVEIGSFGSPGGAGRERCSSLAFSVRDARADGKSERSETEGVPSWPRRDGRRSPTRHQQKKARQIVSSESARSPLSVAVYLAQDAPKIATVTGGKKRSSVAISPMDLPCKNDIDGAAQQFDRLKQQSNLGDPPEPGDVGAARWIGTGGH